MAETNGVLTEKHIRAINNALRRGRRVEVCQSKDEIRVYEYTVTRIDNTQK